MYKNLRVLVVDDHGLMRSMITQSLKSLGVTRVGSAAGSEDAWVEMDNAAASADPYHVILLDWHMPGTDGLEFMRKCRADSRFDKTAIVMLTAEEKEEHAAQAFENGATSYLMKPVSADLLAENLGIATQWLADKGLKIAS